MGRYLYGERSGIYIIDLEKTLSGLEEAYAYARDLGRRGGVILFVGTKKQAQEVISEHAARVGMPFVTTRWLGGMLTNLQTVSRRLLRLRELREMERTGAFDFLPSGGDPPAREGEARAQPRRHAEPRRLPDAIFVIDTKKEHIAVNEARKLGISVIAIAGHELRSGRGGLRDPGQRRCDPIGLARHPSDRGCPGRGEQEGREAVVTRATGPEIEPEPAPAPKPTAAPAPDPIQPRLRGRRGARADRPRYGPGPGSRADGRAEADGGDANAKLVKELRDRTGAGMME